MRYLVAVMLTSIQGRVICKYEYCTHLFEVKNRLGKWVHYLFYDFGAKKDCFMIRITPIHIVTDIHFTSKVQNLRLG